MIGVNGSKAGDSDFGEFTYAPYSMFVAMYGCDARNLRASFAAMKQMTLYFSAEDPMRVFINAFPRQTLATLLNWTADPDPRVRRLASECTRPELPWSTRLDVPYQQMIPILARLFADPAKFVQRSVANHINDIAKIDADFAVDTVAQWMRLGTADPKAMNFIATRGLRKLIKVGNTRALELLGYSTKSAAKVSDLRTSARRVKIGSDLMFEFGVSSARDEAVVVDYVLTIPGHDGVAKREHVFKLKNLRLEPGAVVNLSKRITLRSTASRRLYPGACALEIQVNGKRLARAAFVLTAQSTPE